MRESGEEKGKMADNAGLNDWRQQLDFAAPFLGLRFLRRHNEIIAARFVVSDSQPPHLPGTVFGGERAGGVRFPDTTIAAGADLSVGKSRWHRCWRDDCLTQIECQRAFGLSFFSWNVD